LRACVEGTRIDLWDDGLRAGGLFECKNSAIWLEGIKVSISAKAKEEHSDGNGVL